MGESGGPSWAGEDERQWTDIDHNVRWEWPYNHQHPYQNGKQIQNLVDASQIQTMAPHRLCHCPQEGYSWRRDHQSTSKKLARAKFNVTKLENPIVREKHQQHLDHSLIAENGTNSNRWWQSQQIWFLVQRCDTTKTGLMKTTRRSSRCWRKSALDTTSGRTIWSPHRRKTASNTFRERFKENYAGHLVGPQSRWRPTLCWF